MIPVHAPKSKKDVPIVTCTLTALFILIYLWDRQWKILGQPMVFSDLALRPQEVMHVFTGGDKFPIVTLFTSMFLHGNLLHIAGNLLFLLVFGPSIEAAFGSVRYTLYFLVWGVAAAIAQIAVAPNSLTPVIGASGAISGILGAYLILLPTSRIDLWIFFFDVELPAWVFLGAWFLFQIFVPQNGIANWEHAGGFLAGMLTVLLKGGKSHVMAGREQEFA